MPRSSARLARPSLSGDTAVSYERDFYAWSTAQGALLREGRLDEVDVANVAEEIEDLGRSRRGELRSRTRTLVEHLLKLETSASLDPRRGWMETVGRTRLEIDDLLADSPSLRRELPAILDEVRDGTGRLTARLLRAAGEDDAADRARRRAADLGLDDVYGAWTPGEPDA